MDAGNWITLGVGAFTAFNGWAQFYIKERIFSKTDASTDKVLALFKSRIGITFIAFTGILSAATGVALAILATSDEPLTRLACLQISTCTALTFFNFMVVHSLFTLRRLASLKQDIKDSERRAKAFAYYVGQ
ncbi:hypothetical protein [Massilia sp. erpn]|uniref:hypothetical protein n=1 Tax=Massilia sp. erpn TaxID=2738142 RepID=UPI0021036CB3|nr:hypothetical protein [Massilia sp. erpn]UTY57007.1 hypothetical protein HPQ68_07265 [Massilia sp. erpn]